MTDGSVRQNLCELKAETEGSQQQMVEAKKNERAYALKKLKRLYKEFGFNADLLKVRWLKEKSTMTEIVLIIVAHSDDELYHGRNITMHVFEETRLSLFR